MKKYLVLFILLFFAGITSQAKDDAYAVDDIPSALKRDANAIVRDHQTIFTIESIGKATQMVRHTVTILNERAKNEALFAVRYDNRTKINYIKAYIFDASGKEIKKIRKSDINDISAVSGGNFYGDSRVKYVDLSVNHYPYTVSYEYEVTTDGLLFYPIWSPQDDEDIAIQSAEFKIVTDNTIEPRYREQNIDPVVISKADGQKIYQWTISELPSVDREPFGPAVDELIPIVYTAPNQFDMEGYVGNMSTWDGLGKWQNQLFQGRNNLPAKTKQKIQDLVADKTNDLDRVKAVYDYLQSKTRYVSIQLGIGGWQPFASSFVDENGYGDCKALSFYTKSLLDVIGIKSHYTLVKAGRNESNIRSDFPSRQFNHVILCVPLESDTVWLECTSQTNPFGYVGSFTGDRDVLVITDNGAEVVHTPVYEQRDNQQIRRADVYLERNGNATAQIKTHFKGLQYENNNLHFYISESPSEQMKWLYGHIDIPSFKINAYGYDLEEKSIPEVEETLDLNLPKYASVSGKRIFIPLNLMNKMKSAPQNMRSRTADVVIKKAYIDADTIRYHIPPEYRPEYIPEDIHFQSRFGEYSAKVRVEEGVIIYIRTMSMNKDRNPAATYEELVAFLENIRNADKNKIVLVSST